MHKITVYVTVSLNIGTLQMRVVSNDEVFESGLCDFLYKCIQLKKINKDLNIQMCKMQVNRHIKQKYSVNATP